MKKFLIRKYKNFTCKEFTFAVRTVVLNNGKTIFIPMVRSIFAYRQWMRIVCIYDRFVLQDLDFDVNLTYNDCLAHIEGYKQQLIKNCENCVHTTETVEISKLKL